MTFRKPANPERNRTIPAAFAAEADQTEPAAAANREYQSTMFTSYFGDPRNAALLYEGMRWLDRRGTPRDARALEETEEPIKPEDIIFETLDGVLYLARKNDLAFTVRRKVLVIGEHQSTVNENMPLRSAIYYGRTMEKIIEPRAVYKSKRLPIPTPEFYVFYNGKRPQPLEQTLYLSDSYLEETEHPMLQLEVKVININLSENHPILRQCRPLYEYSWFLGKVREYLEKGKNRDMAIKRAMEASVKEGILTEFIARHGSEVRNMLFEEFNLEEARQVWEEEARENGWEEGRMEGADYMLIQLISKKMKKGKLPETIAQELETDVERIRKLCKAAEAFAPDYDPQAIFMAGLDTAGLADH